MNKSLLHLEINSLLKKMLALNELMLEKGDDVLKIDNDLFQKNCLELYDLTLQIKSSNIVTEITEEQPKAISIEPEISKVEKIVKENEIILNFEEVQQIKEQESIENTQSTLFSELEKSSLGFVPVKNSQSLPASETIVTEIKRKQHDPPSFETIDNKIQIEEKPKIQPQASSKSLHEVLKPEESGKTIHEVLYSGKEENELHKLFPYSKITSISSAIDISKRFELQNNLFAGQSLTYSEAIKSLENAQNKEEAFNTFDLLCTKHRWNQEDELVMELKSFIYRLF